MLFSHTCRITSDNIGNLYLIYTRQLFALFFRCGARNGQQFLIRYKTIELHPISSSTPSQLILSLNQVGIKKYLIQERLHLTFSAGFVSLVNRFYYPHCNRLAHVTNGKSTQRRILAVRFHAHRLTGH